MNIPRAINPMRLSILSMLLIALLTTAQLVHPGAASKSSKKHEPKHKNKVSPPPPKPRVIVGSTSTVTYTSLASCNAAASAFGNTCASGSCTSATACNSTASIAGKSVSCSSWPAGNGCPGTRSGGTCAWVAQLCVSCYTTNGVTMMRVQSNGLPPRCAWAGQIGMVANYYDWEFKFNPAVSSSSLNYSPVTQAAVNLTVCNTARHSTVPSASSFTNYGTTTGMNAIAGMAIDGIILMNPNDADSVDPFYPPVGETVWQSESVDVCLAHPQSGLLYHYHTASPCMIAKPTSMIGLCNTSSSCAASKSAFILSTFTSSAKTLTVIGVGKDGHLIYGPYDSTGSLASGLDVCSGKFNTDGSYSYFATTSYPYFSSCFGPGNTPSYVPTCTTNPTSLGTTWSG